LVFATCSEVELMRGFVFTLTLFFSVSHAAGQTVSPAPAVVLRDLSGRNVRLADFKGKVVLLNFWATWCPPCRAEIPELVKWQNQFRDGLQVIGITYPPTNLRTVRKAVRHLKINYPVLLGSRKTKSLFDQGETLPFSVVMDQQGRIRETIQGILLPEEFESKVRPLLERP
jgi:thiol-disulfide isomerase/thioredoxin